MMKKDRPKLVMIQMMIIGKVKNILLKNKLLKIQKVLLTPIFKFYSVMVRNNRSCDNF